MSNDAAARWYPRATLVAVLIVLAALSRLLPHPPNFTPVEAIGLFAGAYLANRHLAFVIPLLAMALADSVLGFHSGMPVIYGLIAFNVWMGTRLGPDPGVGRVAAYGLGAATVFFVISNFAVWVAANGVYYTQDLAGLITCYTMALPFFAYTLLGMAVYSTVMFGGMAMVRRRQANALVA